MHKSKLSSEQIIGILKEVVRFCQSCDLFVNMNPWHSEDSRRLLDRFRDFVVLVLGSHHQEVGGTRHDIGHCYGPPLAVSRALVADAHEFGFRVGRGRHVRVQPHGLERAAYAMLAAIESLLEEQTAPTLAASGRVGAAACGAGG